MAKTCHNQRHKEALSKLSQYNLGIVQVPFPFNVNILCSDKTKICLDIGPALLVSKLLRN